jgi:ubiquinone/menaquinone biosynthesis C-methylase UbiE
LGIAQEKLAKNHPKMRFRLFDMEKCPEQQGFTVASYDVIIAGAVLHASENMSKTLENVRRLLKTDGKIIIYEPVKPDNISVGFAFGVLPGWWLGEYCWTILL